MRREQTGRHHRWVVVGLAFTLVLLAVVGVL
jgi:hypothetical protein